MRACPRAKWDEPVLQRGENATPRNDLLAAAVATTVPTGAGDPSSTMTTSRFALDSAVVATSVTAWPATTPASPRKATDVVPVLRGAMGGESGKGSDGDFEDASGAAVLA